uniref:Uncharacterized protein n=1 Tax=Opuntia streptacantha TaxID=393608 RepID=A0A7C8YPY8_OPUST
MFLFCLSLIVSSSSSSGKVIFLEVRQGILPKITSDHFLVLQLGTTHTAKKPFKFENTWLEVDDFCDFVKAVWDGFNVSGSSSVILAKKLIFLMSKMKEWNRDVFGHFNR